MADGFIMPLSAIVMSSGAPWCASLSQKMVNFVARFNEIITQFSHVSYFYMLSLHFSINSSGRPQICWLHKNRHFSILHTAFLHFLLPLLMLTSEETSSRLSLWFFRIQWMMCSFISRKVTVKEAHLQLHSDTLLSTSASSLKLSSFSCWYD